MRLLLRQWTCSKKQLRCHLTSSNCKLEINTCRVLFDQSLTTLRILEVLIDNILEPNQLVREIFKQQQQEKSMGNEHSNVALVASDPQGHFQPVTRRVIFRNPGRPGMYDPFRDLMRKFPGGRFLRCESSGIAYWQENRCYVDSGYHLLCFEGMAGSWTKDAASGIDLWLDNMGYGWIKAEFPVYMKDNGGNTLTAGQWYVNASSGQWFLVGLDSRAYSNIFDAFHLRNPLRSVSAIIDPTAVPLLNTTPSASPASTPERSHGGGQDQPVDGSIGNLPKEDPRRGELIWNENLGFGTETEAFIACIREQNYNELIGLFEGTPPLVIIPNDFDAERTLFKAIRNAIAEVEGARAYQWRLKPGPKPEDVVSDQPRYWDWDVQDDISLMFPQNLIKAYGAIQWFGVEITSPAFRATLENVEKIRQVIGHLSRKFRFLCPRVCGTHVHVSRLGKQFTRDELARIASAVFTAGPLISELHHSGRMNNNYCLPNHSQSALATGMTALEACKDLENKTGKSWAPLSKPTMVVAPVPAVSMGRKSGLFPRIRKRGMLQERPRIPAARLLGNVTELMSCPDALTIARLMTTPHLPLRIAYNFQNYTGGADTDEKPTVEFRQAAGTVNADNLVAWVMVVLNLTSVAVLTDERSFSGFLQRCAAGAEDPGVYDVFDLLIDIHLPRTAQYIQSTLSETANSVPWADIKTGPGLE